METTKEQIELYLSSKKLMLSLESYTDEDWFVYLRMKDSLEQGISFHLYSSLNNTTMSYYEDLVNDVVSNIIGIRTCQDYDDLISITKTIEHYVFEDDLIQINIMDFHKIDKVQFLSKNKFTSTNRDHFKECSGYTASIKLLKSGNQREKFEQLFKNSIQVRSTYYLNKIKELLPYLISDITKTDAEHSVMSYIWHNYSLNSGDRKEIFDKIQNSELKIDFNLKDISFLRIFYKYAEDYPSLLNKNFSFLEKKIEDIRYKEYQTTMDDPIP